MTSKIVLYKGKKGSGKTLTMVKDGYNYYKDGWLVLRNFNAKFGVKVSNDLLRKLSRDSPIRNCVIMIDELQILYDARRSSSKTNVNVSNFIQQIRKRNIILLGTTQYTATVEKRIRENSDVVVLPNYIKSLKVCEVIYADVTYEETNPEYFSQLEINVPQQKVVYDATLVFPLYDTEEFII